MSSPEFCILKSCFQVSVFGLSETSFSQSADDIERTVFPGVFGNCAEAFAKVFVKGFAGDDLFLRIFSAVETQDNCFFRQRSETFGGKGTQKLFVRSVGAVQTFNPHAAA